MKLRLTSYRKLVAELWSFPHLLSNNEDPEPDVIGDSWEDLLCVHSIKVLRDARG
jgi:hypothetical protein